MSGTIELKSNIVDLTYLNTCFGENMEAYSKMIQVFLMQTNEKVNDLQKAIQDRNYENTQSIAHFLKSSFGMMGLKCSNDVKKIEELSKSESGFSEIDPLFQNVQSNFVESEKEFQRILNLILAQT